MLDAAFYCALPACDPLGGFRSLIGQRWPASHPGDPNTQYDSPLGEIGLVHMNGRIYDPLLGRFLSADMQVPDPRDLQSYNRYSYCRNNPLSKVDPSGFGDVPPLPGSELDADLNSEANRKGKFTNAWSGLADNYGKPAVANTTVSVEVTPLEHAKVQPTLGVSVPLGNPKDTKVGISGTAGPATVGVSNKGVTGEVQVGDLTVAAGAAKTGADGATTLKLPGGSSITVGKDFGKPTVSDTSTTTPAATPAEKPTASPPTTSISIPVGGPVSVTVGDSIGVGVKTPVVTVKIETNLIGTRNDMAKGDSYQAEVYRKLKEAEEAKAKK